MNQLLPKLRFLGMAGDARKYVLTDKDGAEHRLIISNAQIATAGSVEEPLRQAIARILRPSA